MTAGCKYSIHDEYCELRGALAEASILLGLVCFGVCNLSRREMRAKIQSFQDILARRRKQMRQGCLQCFRKHMGEAAVALEEVHDCYPYKYLVSGHMAHAEEEIREFSPELAKIVRAHRIMLQNDDYRTYMVPFEAFDRLIDDVEALNSDEPGTDGKPVFPEIPEECYAGLEKLSDGSWDLYEGDQR